MYFFVSKIIGFVLLPSNAIVLLCLLGVLLIVLQYRRAGSCAMALGVILLALFSWSPLPNLLLLPLTERFPAWDGSRGAPDGMIILGGGIDSDASLTRGTLEVSASGERVIAMLDLARRYPDIRIVYSGGSGDFLPGGAAEAPIAGELLRRFGVAADRIILETGSRNTKENASRTRSMIAPGPNERWLIVTSAFHMPRAIGLFRAAGFDVEAYPVDFRSRGWGDWSTPFRRASYGLSYADVAVHEWVGLLAAWLSGRSDALLPSPAARPL
jgi:uncharacterized SAM-binding protein YcdF (DUF218 family)